MAALMPRWIATGLIVAFISAGIFDNIRSALSGTGLVKGIKFGVMAFLFSAGMSASYSGVFNLPVTIWFWWGVESLVLLIAGGAVLGWVSAKLSPE